MGVLPIILIYFNRVSVISLISNLLVVPLLEIVTITGMLMAILGHIHISLAQLLGYVNCTLLSFILYVVKVSSSLPFAVLMSVTPSAAAAALYYPVVFGVLRFRPRIIAELNAGHWMRGKSAAAAVGAVAAVIFIMPLFFPGLAGKGFEVVFLDVGEGD
jgi:competence protein ComEC